MRLHRAGPFPQRELLFRCRVGVVRRHSVGAHGTTHKTALHESVMERVAEALFIDACRDVAGDRGGQFLTFTQLSQHRWVEMDS